MPEQGRPGGGGEGFFVNPYTFVPFPALGDAEGFRRPPVGHDRLGDGRYAGHVEVEITSRAPLLLRGVTEDAPGSFPRRRFPDGDGEEAFLPGSGLAGAVRSLHETLVGGCLRVFGADYTPGYRDSAQARGPGWGLALVEEVDGNGRPTRLRWCRRVIWVSAGDLADALGGAEKVVTGARIHIDEKQVRRQDFGAGGSGATVTRDEVWESTAVTSGTSHVVLVTDTRVRRPKGNCWFAVGALDDAVTVPGVTDEAWKRYLNAAADSDDMRRARGAAREKAASGQADEHASKGPPLAEVWFPPRDPAEARAAVTATQAVPPPAPSVKQAFPAALVPKGARAPSSTPVPTPPKPKPSAPEPETSSTQDENPEPALVGCRHQVRRALLPGQVLWAHVVRGAGAPPSVEELAVSHIWRHSGDGAAGERVPEWALPCTEHDDLCPTCRVFGSADTEGTDARDPGKARQDGYRGHLRFSDARPVGDVRLRAVNLPPLGAPRPGAGQFYLDNSRAPSSAQGTPVREWGSRADAPEPRELRGRKYYWLTARHQDRPFSRTPDEPWPGKMGSRAELAQAGARFRFTVSFENLDVAEIGGLLAALSPGQVLAACGPGRASDGPSGEADAYGFGLGGGRPLGFGACTSALVSFTVDTAASWYGEGVRPEVTPREALDAFAATVSSAQRDNWPALAAALRLDHVAPGAVWYPPAKALPSGRLTREHLEAGYDFWTRSRGELMPNKSYPLQPLPGVLDADQRLPVRPPEGPGSKGSNGRPPGVPPGGGRGKGGAANGTRNGGSGGQRP